MPDDAGTRALNTVSQLERIGFVEFTTTLIRETYEIIVQSSIDQLEAYADFVDRISRSAAELESETTGDTGESDARLDDYISNVLQISIPENAEPETVLTITEDQMTFLLEHFAGSDSSDLAAIEADGATLSELRTLVRKKVLEAARSSQTLLETLIKIGVQKIVVTNGEIRTKLTFSVDATDYESREPTDTKTKVQSWGVRASFRGFRRRSYGGLAGKMIGGFTGGIGGGYSSYKINVLTINEKSSAATNVNVDIVGEVRIQFRTETFPAIE